MHRAAHSSHSLLPLLLPSGSLSRSKSVQSPSQSVRSPPAFAPHEALPYGLLNLLPVQQLGATPLPQLEVTSSSFVHWTAQPLPRAQGGPHLTGWCFPIRLGPSSWLTQTWPSSLSCFLAVSCASAGPTPQPKPLAVPHTRRMLRGQLVCTCCSCNSACPPPLRAP